MGTGLLFGITWLTASYDWPGFLIYPLLFTWEIQTKRDLNAFITLIGSGALALGIILWQNYIIAGSLIDPFLSIFSQAEYYEKRIINVFNEKYSPFSWFAKQAVFLIKNKKLFRTFPAGGDSWCGGQCNYNMAAEKNVFV